MSVYIPASAHVIAILMTYALQACTQAFMCLYIMYVWTLDRQMYACMRSAHIPDACIMYDACVHLCSSTSSSSDTVAYIGQLALRSALTPLGYNISYLRETFDIDFARSRKQNMSILKK